MLFTNSKRYASVNSSCALLTPPPSRATAGHFPVLPVPGMGALFNFARPGARASANPGGTPKKFVEVLKGMFS